MKKKVYVQQFNSEVIIDEKALCRIEPALAKAIGMASIIVVSGRPLIRWSEVPTYYNDNKLELDIPFKVSYLRLINIPQPGHSHLDHEFFGEYPAITGFDQKSGIEYLFGVKSELEFSFFTL